MKLRQLIDENLSHPVEADLPLIYHIIRKKLEAGQKVLLPFGSPGLERRVTQLYRSKDAKFPIAMEWAVYNIDDPVRTRHVNGSDYELAELEEKWKLTKADDHWELKTNWGAHQTEA